MTFKDYLLQQYRYQEKTLKQKEKYIKHWSKQISTKQNLDKITTNELLKIIEKQKQNYTNQALNARIQALEYYFYYLIAIGKRKEHPLRNFRIRVEKAPLLTGFLTEKELIEVYSNYPQKGHFAGQFDLYAERNKVPLGLIIFQGLSVGCIEKLELKDIDFKQALINIDTGNQSTFNPRKLPLDVLQILELKNYILHTRNEIETLLNPENTSLLFPRAKNTRLTTTMIAIKKQIAKHYPIRDLKQLRQSKIALWVKQYNIREVQYKTGYKSLMSLEKYNQDSLENLKQAIAKYHPF